MALFSLLVRGRRYEHEEAQSESVRNNETSLTPLTERGHLDRFPAEIREMVYQAYFAIDGGYVFNFATGKLMTPSGQPINLSLMRTCRKIYQEITIGLAVTLNSVTFKTACSADHPNLSPGWFNYLYGEIVRTQPSALLHATPDNDFEDFLAEVVDEVNMQPLMDEETCNKLGVRYPGLEPLFQQYRALQPETEIFTEFDIDRYDAERDIFPVLDFVIDSRLSYVYDLGDAHCDWGEVPSTKRQAIHDAVGLLLQRPMIWPLSGCRNPFSGDLITSELAASAHNLESRYPPWTIPTQDLCRKVSSELQKHLTEQQREKREQEPSCLSEEVWHHEGSPSVLYNSKKGSKFHITAAASAISFLTNLPVDQRMAMRSIILDEDRLGVAKPECHAIGLIPFAQENPKLHITRRVNLWRTVFQTQPCHVSDPDILRPAAGFGLSAHSVSKRLAVWIGEARALVAHGMPKGQFSLVLDAGDAPAQAAALFQNRVQRDVAWQLAFERSVALGLQDPLDFVDEKRCVMYISRDFPAAMKEIKDGIAADGESKSVVSCNFDVGKPWDVDAIVVQNGQNEDDLNSIGWTLKWHSFGDKVDLGPDQPTWEALVEEEFISAL